MASAHAAQKSTMTQVAMDKHLLAAEAALKRGDFKTAADTCKQLLDACETYAPAYALMADMMRQRNNLESARGFIDLAIKFAPREAVYDHLKAQIAIAQKDWSAAETHAKRFQQARPNAAESYLLLGNVELMRGNAVEALTWYQRAYEHEQSGAVCEVIALAYSEQKAHDIALGWYEKALELDKKNPRFYVQVAQSRLERDQIEPARDLLLQALNLQPEHVAANMTMANLCIHEGDYAKALPYVKLAAEKSHYAKMPVGSFVLVLRHFGKFAEAETCLRRALEKIPEDPFLMESLVAVLLHDENKKQETLALMDKVLAQQPGNATMLHTKSALLGQTTAQAPDAYVASLFDFYADRFDEHLTSLLKYETPQQLARVLDAVKPSGSPKWRLLDLGCGTGLGAQAVETFTQARVGVDLSSKMVAKAQSKGIYDELYVAEVVSYLQQETRQFELILAADVLVYVGALEPLFAAASKCCAAGGYFALSIENGDDAAPFVLRSSGRYAHAASYVQTLAEQSGFRVMNMQPGTLRTEGNQPMSGYCCLLQRV